MIGGPFQGHSSYPLLYRWSLINRPTVLFLAPFISLALAAAFLASPVAAATDSGLPWEMEKEYKYVFLSNGINIGEQAFTISETTFQGVPAYRIQESLKISDPGSKLDQDSVLHISRRRSPLKYTKELKAKITHLPSQSGRFNMVFDFLKGSVTYNIKRNGENFAGETVHLPPSVTCFDNNMIDQLSIIFSKVPWRRTREVVIKSFHFSSNKVIDVRLERISEEEIVVSSKRFECYRIRFSIVDIPIGEFWIDRDGRLLREVEKNGALIIELLNP